MTERQEAPSTAAVMRMHGVERLHCVATTSLSAREAR